METVRFFVAAAAAALAEWRTATTTREEHAENVAEMGILWREAANRATRLAEKKVVSAE